MTARQIFEAILIEQSKVNAPSLKLYEFNYLINKAINQYVNKVYNLYDINQQSTDDLRVLKTESSLIPKKTQSGKINKDNIYEIILPEDYLHLLNCVCVYEVKKDISCYDAGSFIEIPATRLTADSWSQIINDLYNRPTPMNPYYYLHNVNKQNVLPTNIYNQEDGSGTDQYLQENKSTEFPRTVKLNLPNNVTTDTSVVQKEAFNRHVNSNQVRCEIRYGKDSSIYELVQVDVDYIKAPQHIRLTQKQIDLTEDTSQIMEFPDYVNQEIINELVHLVMERENNPRLSNHLQMTQTIARPTQQQPQQTT